jgi:hypothetical protein
LNGRRRKDRREKKHQLPGNVLDEGEGRGAIRWQERRCSDCPMWFSVLRPHAYLRTHSLQALRQPSSTTDYQCIMYSLNPFYNKAPALIKIIRYVPFMVTSKYIEPNFCSFYLRPGAYAM